VRQTSTYVEALHAAGQSEMLYSVFSPQAS